MVLEHSSPANEQVQLPDGQMYYSMQHGTQETEKVPFI